MKFEDLGLSPELLRAVREAGYSEPTPIQEKAIPYVLMGRDVLGTAQTGTGKTAAFMLPAIDILDTSKAKARMPRALVLEPTRELAIQVDEAFETYSKYHTKLTTVVLMGGVSYGEQDQKLMRGVDVIIATPGRLLDTFERGRVVMTGVKYLVIDEADRMMDMGFIPDVERIVSLLPKIRQTLFFSATMPPEIRRLGDAFLSNPREIAVDPPSSPAETVTHGLSIVEATEKRDALRKLIAGEDVRGALIFCNRKRDVTLLHQSMRRHGFDVAQLHGDMDQSARTATMEDFREGKVGMLVCSDVAARGLDIQGLSHVFNFDVPMSPEDYIHRIGRTGRAGMRGRSFSFATPEDSKYLAAIEGLIGREIPRFEIEGIGAEMAEGDGRARRRGRSRPEREAPSEGRGGARGGRTKRDGKAKEAAPEAKPKAKIEAPSRRRQGRGDGPTEAGMGEHMPAFLMRPARPKAKD
jgi:superfamily II DNA/RNA helicase